MLPDSASNTQVWLYALCAPSLLSDQSKLIQRAAFEALQVAPSAKHSVSVSESSGWFNYEAMGELWTRRTAPALPSKVDALKAVRRVLAALEQKLSPANPDWPASLAGIVSMLPPTSPMLRDASLRAVPRPDGSAWDHWLYRGEPQLLLNGGGSTRAGVFGTQVEVRIGHGGQVITLSSRWRPLTREKKLVDPTPIKLLARQEGRGGSGGTPPPPFVNFVLDGDGIPQYYLAPYHFQLDEDDLVMSSASPWSLTVDIGRTRQQQEQMTLTALAQGGSGHYAYRWAYHQLDDLSAGIQELGGGETMCLNTGGGRATASSISIPNGHYVMLLNVKDRKTGAFKHHQQQVYSSPFPSSADPSVRLA